MLTLPLKKKPKRSFGLIYNGFSYNILHYIYLYISVYLSISIFTTCSLGSEMLNKKKQTLN